ncbi:MAG: type I-U CRISPR-associated protein Csx17 [Labilithrix sp.]|nr:type I-U CRISPR-associated protein Csx17 [Labilithrix sp.]MCW5816354.1 type I-U CRISPR-associated protein Csx17 [Labilithrix sp.]
MSALHVHRLTGCAPAPLAHYLKGVGVLRVIAEQRDPEARGSWQDEHFSIVTALDRGELERFFLEEYSPTPFVSPWNKGSGFYLPNDPGLTPLATSTAPRFAAFRRGIEAARAPLEELATADAAVRELKERTKARKGMSAKEKAAAQALKSDPAFKAELAAANKRFSVLKADLFNPCQREWRGLHRDWMDAAVVLGEDGAPSFPSLLGTGGNDGRIDFTNNAMQHVARLFDMATGAPTPLARVTLEGALWARAVAGLPGAAVGQFLPGSAGGANATTGTSGGAFVNPWDFVLMLEGAVLFGARSTRQLDTLAAGRPSAPFAVRPHPIGHGSAGDEKAERGEQWMPLWSRPASIADVRALLGEGRAQVGRAVATNPMDAVRAIARLGIARGIRAFARFGYLERNGQQKFAVPLDRVHVVARPEGRLIDDLASWTDRLRRAANDKGAPARLGRVERALANAMYAALTHDPAPGRWQAVLLAAVDVESVQQLGSATKLGPIPALLPAWIEATNDGTAEWRLACALGSAASFHGPRGPHDPIRHHWLPLDRAARRYAEQDGRLARDPRVVMSGRSAASDLVALVERRLLEGTQRGQRRLALVAAPGCSAHLADLGAVLRGAVDLERVSALARAFMAVRWDLWRSRIDLTGVRGPAPDEGWVALRLASLPWALPDRPVIPTDPAMLRRLRAGDVPAAIEVALRRLRAAGLSPPILTGYADAVTARLWASALAFPIGRMSARALARSFEPAMVSTK